MARRLASALGAIALLCAANPASAGIDLSHVGVVRLDNGLTVLLLEDHSLPVVSTQVFYKSGSRDEAPGKTGLAHFLEHLAFRASEHFPDEGATRAIYDAGGEWHGYTWIDETTFFATMPRDGLDLLLRIEADRMAHVTIDPQAIAAEKGAVLAEMHGDENDPNSVLFDQVVATAIQAHPYRNRTIGFERDVEGLTLADARAYYNSHYAPGNAVLAIVGDFDPRAAMALVRKHFSTLPARAVAARTRAVEPVQRGERRSLIAGPVQRQYAKFVYPAPAASSPDFPAFLVLQQLLSGGSGVNFRQNDWGTPAVAGSKLYGVSDDLTSWFIPTADPYVFMVSASIAPGADRAVLERAVSARIEQMQNAPPADATLAAAREQVKEQLAFDVETSEDAAHQLAYFEGIGALDDLLALPTHVAAVSAADVERVARLYLDPQRLTVGWYVPGTPPRQTALGEGNPRPAEARTPAASPDGPVPSPVTARLAGGLPAIIQRSSLSPTVTVALLLSAPAEGELAPAGLAGLGMIERSGMASDLPRLVAAVRAGLTAARPLAAGSHSDDPESRLEQMIVESTVATAGAPRPLAILVSGDVAPDAALAELGKALGTETPGQLPQARTRSPAAPGKLTERIDLPLSQAAIGYVVGAPRPATHAGLAARIVLYALSHGYGGRLGKSAISDSGLVYYIDSAYRTDGAQGWITLASGVDPGKMDAMERLLRAEIARLRTDPPSATEIAAARQHLLGRDLSAAQSNEEIADKLAREFVETGGPRSHAVFSAELGGVTDADVAAAARAFSRGTVLRVDVAPAR